MEPTGCPFCNLANDRTTAQSSAAIACRDTYPVAEGHTLVIPRQHVVSIFDLSAAYQAQLWQLVALVREQLSSQFAPAGFNIGVNDGQAAGQTIPHAHFHIIPRYHGDVADPRGGVRWVIPEKAVYWEEST